MIEKRQILLLVAITLIIAVAGTQVVNYFSHDNDAVVSQYTAIFHADGTLEETFTFKINVEGKHFLYRYWEAPLANKDLGLPQILFLDIDVPDGTYWYLKDKFGHVYGPEGIDSQFLYTIKHEAYSNEAGAFNPNGYAPGEYTIKYGYKVLPPLNYDNEYSNLNLKLASDHIPYKNVRIEIENQGLIEKIYPHPLFLRQVTDENWYIFTGSLAENELLEFEFLMTPEAINKIDGYPRVGTDVRSMTVYYNNKLNIEYLTVSGIFWFNKLATYLLPLGLYGLWIRYGKENDYPVPHFLSTIPNRARKPWIVNLIFKRDAMDFDKDGFYATILDLHERGNIKVEVYDKDVVINIINDRGLDRYERKVMYFLKKIARNGVVKTEYMTDMVEQAQSDSIAEGRVIILKRQYNQLISESDYEVAKEYTENGRLKLIPVALFSALLIFAPILPIIIFNDSPVLVLQIAARYGVITVVQVLVAGIFPSTLFGYWKDNNYREKLEWDAFKRHLTDFSRLQQYGPEDLNMWGMWLVYGTALGVGEQVAEAMQSLKLDYPAMHLVQTYPYWFVPIYTADTPNMPVGLIGGGGSGGSGGGGGFGGGGGGVR